MKIFVLFLTALGMAQAPLRAQLPTITNQPASQTILAGASVTFAVGVSGVGPFTYQWQLNNTNLPNGIITTVAGNGSVGYSGDGGAATNARLNGPYGVAMDAYGNFFIADSQSDRIRQVGTNGIIMTVAGNGSAGYYGDGDAATNASFNGPYGVSMDTYGNLLIVDSYNQRIRQVRTNGIITTVAGNGVGGYSGDGGVATNASLYFPYGVAVDASGNLFIADTFNQRIRQVRTNGIITLVAGNGTSGYSGDGGAATNAKLGYPSGVAVDAYGECPLNS